MQNVDMLVEKQVLQIATDYEKAMFEHSPELGQFWGSIDTDLFRFNDRSLSELARWHAQQDQFLERLNNIESQALKAKPAFITYQLLKQTLENEQATRICKDELWKVDPFWGWLNTLTMLVGKQPLGTDEYRAQALQRWGTFDKVVDDEICNLKIGLKEGYSAPKPVVKRVIHQVEIILDASVEQSPYFELATRDGDEHFKAKIVKLIEEKINPSLKRYLHFLETEYLSKARETIGISALPNGEQCYQAKVRMQTTLDISPHSIHEYGLQHMQQLCKEIIEIGQQEYGSQEIVDIFNRAKTDPRFSFHSEQEIIDYNLAALKRAQEKVSLWFDKIPKAEGILKPYPLHRAKTGAVGEYHPPSEDGQRPGIFYINTYDPKNKWRFDQEAILFHELVPGHHFQVALAQEDKSNHSLNKCLWNPGYGEGWALYVERLADKMGIYTNNISRLGMLSCEALRTARLVVDPGIHVIGWSREQAIDYMKKHTALQEKIIEAEVDRYIMIPGQATSYMLGKREIERLRDSAQEKLGQKFNIREYHNQVLKNGAITLPMLREQINAWLES